MSFCGNCGQVVREDDKFCPNCGSKTTQESENLFEQEKVTMSEVASTSYADRGSYSSSTTGDFSYLSDYYKREFTKIQESNGVYTGKWNWAAFWFGALWALSKGLWLSAVIVIVLSIFTSGIAGLIYCVIIAIRGNYLYYNKVVNGKQMII